MKVAELIELLEGQDPKAEVLIGSQPSYPFEYGVSNVISREEIGFNSDECDPCYTCEGEGRVRTNPANTNQPKPCPDCNGSGYSKGEYEDGCESNDVFITEGTQLRYGSKNMWE